MISVAIWSALGEDRSSQTLPPAVALSTSTFKRGSVWPFWHRGKGSRALAPKFQLAAESPGGLWKFRSQGPFWASDSLGLGVGPNAKIICIFNKFRGPAAATGAAWFYVKWKGCLWFLAERLLDKRTQLLWFQKDLHFIAFSNLLYTSHRKNDVGMKAKSESSVIRDSQRSM